MDIVLTTNHSREELLKQTIRSLSNWVTPHHRVVVAEDNGNGACDARNRGAHHFDGERQKYLMFIDDDVYLLPRWDEILYNCLNTVDDVVISGHAHPYNVGLGIYSFDGATMEAAGVLSTVHLCMPWKVWDSVGEFHGVGGPGGSEDVEWCARAIALGFGLAVTVPHCVIHCGYTNSVGKELVGLKEMKEQNDKLVKQYGVEVIFQ